MTMDVQLVATWQEARYVDMRNRIAVVIDVLRASSTIIAALNSGADCVETVDDVDVAMARAHELGRDTCVLAGERGSVKLPHFDLGNSPLEFTPDVVNGKRVILTTTNGTQAVHVSRDADAIVIASMLNVSAVADWLLEHEKDVTIICSGTEGRLSLDDIHCGGLLASKLFEPGFTPQLNDGVRIALQWFAANAGNAPYVLASCTHGQRLISQGFEKDVQWCAQIDTIPIAPIWDGTGFVAHTT